MVIDLPVGVIIDRLSDVMVNVGVEILTGEIIMVTAVVLSLQFVGSVSYAVDVPPDAVMNFEALSGALANAITFVVTDICADLLDDVSTDVLLVVMAVLEFIFMPTSLEDSLLFC